MNLEELERFTNNAINNAIRTEKSTWQIGESDVYVTARTEDVEIVVSYEVVL